MGAAPETTEPALVEDARPDGSLLVLAPQRDLQALHALRNFEGNADQGVHLFLRDVAAYRCVLDGMRVHAILPLDGAYHDSLDEVALDEWIDQDDGPQRDHERGHLH